jgi:hypothetical protein
MKTENIKFLVSILLIMVRSGNAQGFVDLDFEDANIAPTPVNGFGGAVDPAMAFPGWTIGGSGTRIWYNNLTLGSPAVILMGPNSPNGVGFTPLEGSYSAWIYYNNGGSFPPPTISQTGLVPANAQSISFLIGNYRGDPSVSLNGVNISLVPVLGGRLAGNVSAFAGSVARLTFTTSNVLTGDNFLYFDDVQFSTTPVPEPSEFVLTALGALLLSFRRRTK